MLLSEFRSKTCGFCRYYQADFCAVAPDYIGLAYICPDFKLAEEIEEEEEVKEISVIEQFKKDYLVEFLSTYGDIEAGRSITTPTNTEIDLWVVANRSIKGNHLLKKLLKTRALFEYYHNSLTSEEVLNSLRKLIEMDRELDRFSRAKKKQLSKSELPQLWILTPSISQETLTEFVIENKQNNAFGIYYFPPAFLTAFIIIDRLPVNKETLWLRILGQGEVFDRAMEEVLKNNIETESLKKLVTYFRELNFTS
ncbi:hypothetical protein ACN4EE_17140 [Geminocystis sp. CENA526]|uniref:hypothetical protein n=1 Tax=Geminocystis sp. CENA526 TaxID=1355871 RepID=UPI003D6E5C2C